MGENSAIEWTDHTMNPWIGCEEVSPECDNCYARQGSARLGAQHGLKLWEGDRYFTKENYWKAPAAWNRKAVAEGRRARVFCASYADVFEDRPELVERRKRLFDTIADTPHLDWLLLTKRPQNIGYMLPSYRAAGGVAAPWPNVWLGTTCGIEASLPRVVELLRGPKAVAKFVSVEPLLDGGSDLSKINLGAGGTFSPTLDAFTGQVRDGSVPETSASFDSLSWVIVGGESGAKARPFDVRGGANIIDQCQRAGVAAFMKQLGRRPHDNGRELHLADAHGGDWDEWPAWVPRVRQWPEARS